MKEEVEARKHDTEVVPEKALSIWGSGSTIDMSWWRQYANVSELLRRGRKRWCIV